MALRDKLRVLSSDQPEDLLNASIEIGDDILELQVTRRDISPAFDREMVGIQIKGRAEIGIEQDSESVSIVEIEILAKRLARMIIGYRTYPKTATEAEIEAEAWLRDFSEKDMLDLPNKYYWRIANAVMELRDPNAPSGENT